MLRVKRGQLYRKGKVIPKRKSIILCNLMGNARSTSKKGRFKTSALKYSSSLYEKPIGSFNFIRPEKINKPPTSILQSCTIYFIILFQKTLNTISLTKINVDC